jgi:hypothetical protein
MPSDPANEIDGVAQVATGRRRVAVVPHTHWDREWYAPFQTFRMGLVRLVDELLDLLESDPSYRHFMLDGQLAVIDDYLEIRPENEERLRALAAAGRLTLGPWYILMDEFLVSAETIVRDLQAGMARGASFGGVMDVGYLPDMFGHVAQMPQILAQAGLEHAVVWRGVPSAVDGTGFLWSAPDGSSVRAEYLIAGYGNGAALPEDAKQLVRRIQALIDEADGFLAPGAPLLVMNGSDHLRPQPWLGRIIAEANDIQGDLELEVTSLSEYLASTSVHGLPAWTGELRSGWRSNVLMGVGSNRVDVKQAASRAERSLEQYGEPLSALYLSADRWPTSFLELAWKLVIRNAAHDSICACSADDVVDAVLHRYSEARHIGEGLTDMALASLGRSMAAAGPVVANPCARTRGGMVDVVVPAIEDPGPHVQVISERPGLPGTITLAGEVVRTILGVMQGSRLDEDTYVTASNLTVDPTGIDLTLVLGPEPREDAPVEEIKRELFTRLAADPDTEVRVAIDQPAQRRILARMDAVPGFGWATVSPSPLTHPVTAATEDDGSVTLENGLAHVVIDPSSGTFAIDGVAGFGRLVDDGDFGDTYNYSPPATDTVIDVPDTVSVTVVDTGPVRASVDITTTWTWPERVDEVTNSRVGQTTGAVITTLELRADESLVRVRTRWTNPSRDHRLRVHLPLPQPAATSRAECAFTVVERGLTAEGRPEEFGLPTFPSRRFVSSGGLTVVHEGLLEYELVDINSDSDSGARAASTLALTLLRATGKLSRLGMSLRPMPAGPLDDLEGPQMLQPVDVTYGLALHHDDPYALAEDLLVPLGVTSSFGGGSRPDRGAVLTVTGAQVSSLRRHDGALELRVFNPTDHSAVVEIPGRRGWLVDLRGRAEDPFEERFSLRPHGIATIRLDD